jgi:hypothetical protein
MRISRERFIAAAGLLFVSAFAYQCTSKPEPATPQAAPSIEASLTPVLSVKELMEHIIDPTADFVFDAVGVDVSAKGTVETKPVSDEDWLKVERGALQLAESTNLLKMRRPMAPAGEEIIKPVAGKPAPELPPAEIQAKIDKDRALWNKYADGLRDASLESLKIAKARDVNGLFDAGSKIDAACESCHLEYWYPGDKKAVLADQQKRVTYDPPKK